ncbi:hypothetical protein [Spirosoma koreense]
MTPELTKLQELFLKILKGGNVEKIRTELDPIFWSSKGLAVIDLFKEWVEKGKKEIDEQESIWSQNQPHDVNMPIVFHYPLSQIFEIISIHERDTMTKKAFDDFYNNFYKAIQLLLEAKRNQILFGKPTIPLVKKEILESNAVSQAIFDSQVNDKILIITYGDPSALPQHYNNKELTENSAAPNETFADLFNSPEELTKYVNILREFRPNKPVINDNNKWLGGRQDKSKMILIGWLDRLQYRDKIPRQLDRKRLVLMLENFFQGLKFGEKLRYFYNPVNHDIKEKFEKLIP